MMARVFVAVQAISLFSLASSFSSHQRTNSVFQSHVGSKVRLFGLRDDTSDDDWKAARERFEQLMGGNDNNGEDTMAVQKRPVLDVSNSPPLTTIGKERRLAEINFLSQLTQTDEPLDGLWSLWFSERGSAAARSLRQAEEWSKEPQTWPQAEVRLRQLISEHERQWAEPINRLATLLYMQGRFVESKNLCEEVLKIKPWHFGALSGIVMVHAELHDVAAARYWASQRLPQITQSRKRKEWVERSINDAGEMLSMLEIQTNNSYGESEHPENPPVSFDIDFEDDAWQ